MRKSSTCLPAVLARGRHAEVEPHFFSLIVHAPAGHFPAERAQAAGGNSPGRTKHGFFSLGAWAHTLADVGGGASALLHATAENASAIRAAECFTPMPAIMHRIGSTG